MDFLQTLIGFCVALFVLVSVHEFGHFYVARLCGVKVLRFCIGMGRPFWSFRDKKGTEFGLAPIPLGGYVKMLDEREGQVAPEERHLSYNSKSPWQRIAILAAGPFANFLLAFVVFWVLVGLRGSFGITPVVGAVEPGSLASRAGLEAGQTITAVDGQTTATRQDVYERLLMRLGESGVMTLSLKEPDSDLVYDAQVELAGWMKGAVDPDPAKGLGFEFFRPDVVIADVIAGGAAQEAGLQKGDRLVAVDSKPIGSLQSWVDYVQARAGQVVVLTLERNGEQITLNMTPRATTLDDGRSVGQVGVQVQEEAWPEEMLVREEFSLPQALAQGLEKTWQTTQFVLVSMKKLVVGEISTKNLSGPIGIAKVAGDQAQAGLVYFIEFLAVLSVYLGVLNLLPIPVLDGGHILYCLVEAVKGSPVSERIQMMGYSAGLAVLACVMVVAFYNDILRLY